MTTAVRTQKEAAACPTGNSSAAAAVIQAALQKEGYEVFIAHDGIEGLKAAMTHLPDLIISDTVMPPHGRLQPEELTCSHPLDRVDSNNTPYFQGK
ncbi:MAG TPA: hypothetical protein VK187_01810, partial [Geobacteraceae bacterium]|nr:hypothetical protein [Geobacteraceae bacterium]